MIEVTVSSISTSWTQTILERTEIVKIFQNPSVEKVFIPTSDSEPEILTKWDVFQSFYIDGRWILSTSPKDKF